MKKVKIVMIIGLMATLGTVYAQEQTRQQGERRQQREFRGHGPASLDLSDEQKSKASELKLGMQKMSLPLKNQLGENKAKLRTLTTAENADMKAINKLIDKNADINAELQKLRAANHQDFRNMLTEEQRIKFDSRAHEMRREREHRRGARGQQGQKGQPRQIKGELE